MCKIVLIAFILTLYAMLTGITYAVLKRLGLPEGVKEAFALFFPLGIPLLIFISIVYYTHKLVYKLFKWK